MSCALSPTSTFGSGFQPPRQAVEAVVSGRASLGTTRPPATEMFHVGFARDRLGIEVAGSLAVPADRFTCLHFLRTGTANVWSLCVAVVWWLEFKFSRSSCLFSSHYPPKHLPRPHAAPSKVGFSTIVGLVLFELVVSCQRANSLTHSVSTYCVHVHCCMLGS